MNTIKAAAITVAILLQSIGTESVDVIDDKSRVVRVAFGAP